MDLFVAVDAGQTHTECVAVDHAGNVVVHGHGGPSYVQDGSMMVRASFDAAMTGLASLSHGDVRVVLVGATGGQIPGRLSTLADYFHTAFPQAMVRVISDADFVLASCVGDGPGGILIAGTGSIATGQFGGRHATVGGYGYLFGDEGAGVWLVLETVRHCLRLADAREPLPTFVGALNRYFGVDDMRQIPGVIYARGAVDVNTIARAATIITSAAADGDADALRLTHACAHALADLAGRLAQALELPNGTTFPLYLIGGIWGARAIIEPEMKTALPHTIDWELHYVAASPTIAAAHYARRLARHAA